jgi:putative transposase
VVLSDHMNCVWTLPEGDADSSGRWREIKGQFSMALRRTGRAPTHAPENPHGARGGREKAGARPDLRKNEVSIWQKRFWERHSRCDEEFAACVQYCWLNPVKHGLVEHQNAWPHS